MLTQQLAGRCIFVLTQLFLCPGVLLMAPMVLVHILRVLIQCSLFLKKGKRFSLRLAAFEDLYWSKPVCARFYPLLSSWKSNKKRSCNLDTCILYFLTCLSHAQSSLYMWSQSASTRIFVQYFTKILRYKITIKLHKNVLFFCGHNFSTALHCISRSAE